MYFLGRRLKYLKNSLSVLLENFIRCSSHEEVHDKPQIFQKRSRLLWALDWFLKKNFRHYEKAAHDKSTQLFSFWFIMYPYPRYNSLQNLSMNKLLVHEIFEPV